MCNRCGEIVVKWVELGQNDQAFAREYCNDPEWGRACWDWIVNFQLEVTGCDIRAWGVRRSSVPW